MSDSSVENQIKKLVEERNYEEAKALLKSSYNLSDEQAVEFIKKLEQSASSQSKMIKPGIAGKLANGCGCFAIFFFLFFVWGVYSMFTSQSDSVEVKGMVVGYFEEESTKSDAKMRTYYAPIVIYSYENKDYRDTLITNELEPRYAKDEAIDLYIDPTYPQYATDETSFSSSAMYIPYLVFSILSFLAYRYLKRFKFNFKATEIGKAIGQMKSEAANADMKTAGETVENNYESDDASSKPKAKQASIKVVFGLAFVLLFVGGGLLYLNYRAHQRGDRIKAGETISGIITSENRRKSSGSNGRIEYHYIISYEYKGDLNEYKTILTYDDYNRGDKVEMKINPDDPDEVAINTSADLYGRSNMLLIIIFIGLGGLFTYAGVHMVIKKIKKK